MGILTPIINILIAMGASTLSANLLIIILTTSVCYVFGLVEGSDSTILAKFLAIIGFVFITALVILENFPWLHF
jgi:hypothetical protein